MAIETPCQTPGVLFHVGISGRQITVWIELPAPLDLTDEQAETLDANLHNAMELVLAPYFRGRGEDRT